MLAAQERAISQMHSLMDLRELQYRVARIAQNRARRRTIVNLYLKHRDDLLGYLSAHPAPRNFNTASEAIGWFRKEIRRQRGLAENSHYAFSSTVLRECKDRLIIARYFARGEASEAKEALIREAA